MVNTGIGVEIGIGAVWESRVRPFPPVRQVTHAHLRDYPSSLKRISDIEFFARATEKTLPENCGRVCALANRLQRVFSISFKSAEATCTVEHAGQEVDEAAAKVSEKIEQAGEHSGRGNGRQGLVRQSELNWRSSDLDFYVSMHSYVKQDYQQEEIQHEKRHCIIFRNYAQRTGFRR